MDRASRMENDNKLIRPTSCIGIGNVFLPYERDDDDSAIQLNGFSRWEITGILKSKPEDFIVREISAGSLQTRVAAQLTDAYSLPLEEQSIHQSKSKSILYPANVNDTKIDVSKDNDEYPTEPSLKKKRCEEKVPQSKLIHEEKNDKITADQQNSQKEIEIKCSFKPLDQIRGYLSIVAENIKDDEIDIFGFRPKTPTSSMFVQDTISSIQDMHDKTKADILDRVHHNFKEVKKDEIKFASNKTITTSSNSIDDSVVKDDCTDKSKCSNNEVTSKNIIWIPPHPNHNSSNTDDNDNNTSNNEPSNKDMATKRGNFHKAIRNVYPLLKTNTTSFHEVCKKGMEQNSDGKKKEEPHPPPTQSNGDDKWINVEMDDMFFELIPYLLFPLEDLLSIYSFRNKGIPEIDENNTFDVGYKKKSRKQGGRSNKTKNNSPEVLLRIDPLVENKEMRRKIHHIISSSYKDFETSTRTVQVQMPERILGTQTKQIENLSNTPGATTETPQSTKNICSVTAIVVQWSHNAYRKKKKSQQKKRKMINNSSGDHNGNDLNDVQNLRGDYLTRCVLQKRNLEHLTCINHLTRTLRCRTSDIGMAGIKDMCAITSQFVTFRNISAKKLIWANERLKEHRVELGNFERIDFFRLDDPSKTNMLNRGDLAGNQFEITLRNLCILNNSVSTIRVIDNNVESTNSHVSADTLDKIVKRVRSFGFINFYGEQRVGIAGSSSDVGIRPFDIGRAMLQEKYELAIDFLMEGRNKRRRTSFDGFENNLIEDVSSSSSEKVDQTKANQSADWVYVENDSIREARALWKTSKRDASAVLKYMSSSKQCNSMTRERTVLQGLKRYGKQNPLAALQCLHFNIRFFWINAYQSYVWNLVATKRIQRLGMKTVVGDLYYSTSDEETRDQDNDAHQLVKAVTSEELASTVKFTSVVLPLPGHDVKYPQNEVGDLYRQILEEDNVVFDKNKIPESTARGSYRRLVSIPRDLRWEQIKDTDHDHDTNKSSAGSANGTDGAHENYSNETVVDAAKFTFELNSGSYATMMLRELLFTKL